MNWNWAMCTAISTVSTDVESAYMAVRSHKNQFIHKLSASCDSTQSVVVAAPTRSVGAREWVPGWLRGVTICCRGAGAASTQRDDEGTFAFTPRAAPWWPANTMAIADPRRAQRGANMFKVTG